MQNEVAKFRTKKVNGSSVTWAENPLFCEASHATRKAVNMGSASGVVIRYTLTISALDYESCVVNGEEPSEVEYNGKIYVIDKAYGKYGTDLMEVDIGVKL